MSAARRGARAASRHGFEPRGLRPRTDYNTRSARGANPRRGAVEWGPAAPVPAGFGPRRGAIIGEPSLQASGVEAVTGTAMDGDGTAPASEAAVAAASAAAAPPSRTALAVRDIAEGARAIRLWGLLGWQDVRHHYRRSVLGPFWFTISMGTLVGALGVLYAGLFKAEIADYLPFIATGFIVWGLVSGLINEGCSAFIGAERVIKQVGLPLSIHVYRLVWRNFIVLAHNALIFVVVAVLFSVQPGWAGLAALPGLALLGLNGVWVGLLLGLLCARFRDVPQIVGSIVQIAFFLTPIIWKPELLSERALVVDLNPFYHLLELVRAPLLGQAPRPVSWFVALGITLGGWALALAAYRHYRWRISYWV